MSLLLSQDDVGHLERRLFDNSDRLKDDGADEDGKDEDETQPYEPYLGAPDHHDDHQVEGADTEAVICISFHIEIA